MDNYTEKVAVVKSSITSGPISGQKYLIGTAAAVKLSATSVPVLKGVVIKNPSANGASVFVGAAGANPSTGFEIEPGEKEFIPVADLANLYVYSNSNQVISYLAS